MVVWATALADFVQSSVQAAVYDFNAIDTAPRSPGCGRPASAV